MLEVNISSSVKDISQKYNFSCSFFASICILLIKKKKRFICKNTNIHFSPHSTSTRHLEMETLFSGLKEIFNSFTSESIQCGSFSDVSFNHFLPELQNIYS